MNKSECDKLLEVEEKSQMIGEFLEWLNCTKNYSICQTGEQCNNKLKKQLIEEFGDNQKSINEIYADQRGNENFFYVVHYNTDNLLAEFFNIDLKKVEKEKKEALKKQRSIKETKRTG